MVKPVGTAGVVLRSNIMIFQNKCLQTKKKKTNLNFTMAKMEKGTSEKYCTK